VEIKHDENRQRFEIDLGGKRALLEYRRIGNSVAFTHTEVPPEFEGQGIAGKLVEEGLTWAKAEGATVVPQCSYVVGYIRRHPEWTKLVDAAWMDKVQR
jgi:predicted GNAT family acetyltransferase